MQKKTTKISFHNVNKYFHVNGSAKQVLSNIDFSVEEGEFICILGSSGCGKSTILNLISGLDKEYSGQIMIDGQEGTSNKVSMSYLFQEPRLLPWLNVEQNIHFALESAGVPKNEWQERTAHYLEMVNLAGCQKHYIHQLSGGMQHRVSIARAFSVNPDILLMDEPFGALDELTAREIRKNLLDVWQRDKKTVLFVTHNTMEATYLSDKIFMMSANPGTVDEIILNDLQRPRLYESEELFLANKKYMEEFMKVSGHVVY